MSVSPSSSAQAAREAVAGRLRDLRKEAGLTIVELARRCGWHYSKTSRIENSLTGPTATDIRRWCKATNAEDQAQDLIVRSLKPAGERRAKVARRLSGVAPGGKPGAT